MRRMPKWIPLLVVIATVAGCTALPLLMGCSTPNAAKPLTMTYPQNYEAFCQAAVESAKDFLALKGCPVEVRKSYIVTLHEGEEQVDGAWAWNTEKFGMVAGLTIQGKTLVVSQLGCKPVTKDEVRWCDAMHEALEYWSLSNFNLTIHELAERDGWNL